MSNQDWLLVRWPAQAGAPLSWVAADATGQLLSVPSTDAGGALHTMSTGRRVALIVPGSSVSLFEVALPAGNEARLLQLAPFALEDQVSQDVDLLHFAVGSRDPVSALVPVCVTERSHMTQWMARCAELQLLPRAVYADTDLAPVLPGHIALTLADDQLLLRQDTGRALQLPAADPLLALEMLLGAEADLSGVHLAVYASPEDWERHRTAIEALREQVASFTVQLNAGGLLALLAQGLAHATPVNLLQGAFRPQPSARSGWRQWRAVAGVALLLVALHAFGSWWELRQLRQSASETDAAITRLYQSIFPGQSPGAQPRRQLQQRLDAIAGGGGLQGELMSMLAALAAARQNVPVAELQSLNFSREALQMRVSVPDAGTLEQFSQALRAGGYTTEITAGTQRGERFEGQIQMRAGGA